MHTTVWLEIIQVDHLEELGVNGRIIHNLILLQKLFILPPAAVWNLVGGPVTGVIPSRSL